MGVNQRHFGEKMQVAVIILLTPSVNEAVVVAEIMLYQWLEVLSFFNQERS